MYMGLDFKMYIELLHTSGEFENMFEFDQFSCNVEMSPVGKKDNFLKVKPSVNESSDGYVPYEHNKIQNTELGLVNFA